jgi:hypothetical protein
MPLYPPPNVGGGGISLQAVTPGVTDTGHGHISGTFIADTSVGIGVTPTHKLDILQVDGTAALNIAKSGASGQILIGDANAIAGSFEPYYFNYVTGNQFRHASMATAVDAGSDTGTVPLFTFDGRRDGAALVNRPIFAVTNYGGAALLQVSANGDAAIGSSWLTVAKSGETVTLTSASTYTALTQINFLFAGPKVSGGLTNIWFDSAAQLMTDALSLRIGAVAGTALSISAALIGCRDTAVFGWSNDGNPAGTADIGLSRSSAGILQVGDGAANDNGALKLTELKFHDGTSQTTAATGGSFNPVADPFILAVS